MMRDLKEYISSKSFRYSGFLHSNAVVGMFVLPVIFCVYYGFWFPMIFSGIGNVGENRLNRVSHISMLAYQVNPYWVPALGLVFIPFVFRSITSRKWRIVLMITYCVFALFVYKTSQSLLTINLDFIKGV